MTVLHDTDVQAVCLAVDPCSGGEYLVAAVHSGRASVCVLLKTLVAYAARDFIARLIWYEYQQETALNLSALLITSIKSHLPPDTWK